MPKIDVETECHPTPQILLDDGVVDLELDETAEWRIAPSP